MGTPSDDIDADSRRIPSMNPTNDGRSGRSWTVYGQDDVVEACTGLAPPWLSPLVPLAWRPAHLSPAWAGCDQPMWVGGDDCSTTLWLASVDRLRLRSAAISENRRRNVVLARAAVFGERECAGRLPERFGGCGATTVREVVNTLSPSSSRC